MLLQCDHLCSDRWSEKLSTINTRGLTKKKNSQYITVLLEQINHLRAENKDRTCIIQALVEK